MTSCIRCSPIGAPLYETGFICRTRKGCAVWVVNAQVSFRHRMCRDFKDMCNSAHSIQPETNVRIAVTSVSDQIRAVSDLIRISPSSRASNAVKMRSQANQIRSVWTKFFGVARSRVSVWNEDAADGVEMKAVYSALDGHDPGA